MNQKIIDVYEGGTDCGSVHDRVGLHVQLLHLLQQARRCHPLLALLACMDGGTLRDRVGLHVPLLHLPKQCRRRDPMPHSAFANCGAVRDH